MGQYSVTNLSSEDSVKGKEVRGHKVDSGVDQ